MDSKEKEERPLLGPGDLILCFDPNTKRRYEQLVISVKVIHGHYEYYVYDMDEKGYWSRNNDRETIKYWIESKNWVVKKRKKDEV